jgi:hypothetical protein
VLEDLEELTHCGKEVFGVEDERYYKTFMEDPSKFEVIFLEIRPKESFKD